MRNDQSLVTYEKGLPAAVEVEKLVLGAVLLNGELFLDVASRLTAEDFMIEKHRRIFQAMIAVHDDGKRIDRITVANGMNASGLLQAIGGLSYLVSLDDELPQILNLDSYVEILQDKALARRLIHASQSVIDRCLVGRDRTRDVLADAESGLLDVAAGAEMGSSFHGVAEIVGATEGGLDGLMGHGRAENGIRTGFYDVDDCLGGLHESQLIIIAGRPAMGKTAFAMNIGTAAALAGKTVAVFSLEMSKESLLARMIACEARVSARKYAEGALSGDEVRALGSAAHRLAEAPIFIDDTAGLSLIEMHSKLRRLKAERGGLDLVIIDYLQLMTAAKAESRVVEVSALSRGLKLAAKDLKVPLIVLSQLSRAPENRAGDHRPQLSDLRESGSIEQDADVVGFLFREEYYKRDRAELKGKAEFIVAKQRSGPTRTIPLVFLDRITRFENYCGTVPGGGDYPTSGGSGGDSGGSGGGWDSSDADGAALPF